ncbi:protein RCC2 [Tanacetum coccineum]
MVASSPSSGIGVVNTYTTLMLESKKCIFFCHFLKSTPSNLSSLAKFEAMCFIAAASIDYHKIIFFNLVKAGIKGGHTVVQTEDGFSFSFGWKLGTGSIKNEAELYPVQCLITDVRDVACGTDFIVSLTSLKGASIRYGES